MKRKPLIAIAIIAASFPGVGMGLLFWSDFKPADVERLPAMAGAKLEDSGGGPRGSRRSYTVAGGQQVLIGELRGQLAKRFGSVRERSIADGDIHYFSFSPRIDIHVRVAVVAQTSTHSSVSVTWEYADVSISPFGISLKS